MEINNNPTDERVEAKVFLAGGKVRVGAPIPWIAPYIEFGIGASVGEFKTLTDSLTEEESLTDEGINIDRSGLVQHVPISLELELGRNNEVDLAFTYYFHKSVELTVGTVAFGITLPLRGK